MPSHDRLVVFPRTSSDTFVLGVRFAFPFHGCSLVFGLLLRLDGDVDVTNFVVHLRDEVHTSDLGDDGQCLRILPRIVDERCMPGLVSLVGP